ncbi:uncharacterized protein LOC124144271 [Haliotis rufescens]|uniref:uncharacterized protein LOC124144271 n=1 Tax=Haliotis rufescens TaxID=6454 RepID=UPI00201EF276|nr:uncharacterized protein LOC124144271 [Haliotis rufescens]
MCSVIRKEFRVRNAWLNFERPDYFGRSQLACSTNLGWTRPAYVIYRLLIAAYACFALVHIFIKSEDNFNDDVNSTSHNVTQPRQYHAIVFLTVWTYTLLTCHLVLAFIISLVYFKHAKTSSTECQLKSVTTSGFYDNATFTSDAVNGLVRENNKSVVFDNENNVKIVDGSTTNSDSSQTHVDIDTIILPWYSKISWLLSNIVSTFAIIVTAIFFGVLYTSTAAISLEDMNVHALNTVFIVVDNVVSARPMRLLHVIYPVVYGLCYVVFSAIYWAYDHRNVIYPIVLDWNNVGLTLGVTSGITVLTCVLHVVQFALYRLRLFVYEKCCSN